MSVGKLLELDRPLIMAHRGDPTAAPENSLLAMQSALEICVDVLETDVRLIKDDVPILFHDEDLSRITGVSGTVREKTLDELLEIDLGSGQRIVTLRKALQEFPETVFNIDIKDELKNAPEIIANLIRELNREISVIVASYHDLQINRFRQIMPDLVTAASPGEISRFVFAMKMRFILASFRNPPFQVFQVPVKYGDISVVDPRFIYFAHKRDLAVHVWTINDRETMEHLIDLGVDGIFTDEPNILRQVLLDKGLL